MCREKCHVVIYSQPSVVGLFLSVLPGQCVESL